ncbi:MAG: hypothetical protein ACRESY_00550, partial [Steroidobacteraceae bacterium]
SALSLCVVSFVLVWPIVVPIYVALGNEALVLITLNVIFAGLGLIALIGPLRRSLQLKLIALAALCTLAGLAITPLLAPHTAELPQPITLRYLLDTDRQRADWVADPEANPLPGSMQRAGNFQHRPPRLYAWDQALWSAPAPMLPLAAPQLTLLSAQPTSGGVRYRLHVASARDAPRVMLRFSASARVRTLEIGSGAGDTVRAQLALLPDGSTQWCWYGARPQGLDLSLETAADGVDGQVLDVSFGLPRGGLGLQQSRPATAVPHYDGDVTLVAAGFHLRP